jgi:cytochrome c biogenesis factor
LFTENKITLKPEYFDKITTPFGLALLLLITVCPHLLRTKAKKNWRIIDTVVIAAIAIGIWYKWHITKVYDISTIFTNYPHNMVALFEMALLLLIAASPHLVNTKINKDWRTVGAIIVAMTAAIVWIMTRAYTIPCFIICAFGLINLIADVIGYETSFAKRAATSPNARRNFQWYGARIVHIGVVLTFLGLAGAGGYSVEKFAAIVPGDTAEIGAFKLQYKEMTAEHGPNFTAVAAEIEVYRNDKMLTTLTPSKAFYGSGKPVSEVSIRRTLGGDLYTALTEADKATKMIKLRMLIKPLINWVWIGSILSVLGTMVVLASLYQKKVLS